MDLLTFTFGMPIFVMFKPKTIFKLNLKEQ